jgi:hypothetical protein
MNDVISLSKYIRQLRQAIDEHEWEGEYRKADVLRECLNQAEKRQLDGELWQPMF